MTTTDAKDHEPELSQLSLVINILSAPNEAFVALKRKPTKLFPFALILALNAFVLVWYFSIVDFAWYIDDVLSSANLDGEQLEAAREGMNSMSKNMFMGFGILGSLAAILGIYTLQSGYLSLVSALSGVPLKFGHWFSLQCWSGMPMLLSLIGMCATIVLSPNGQLSPYDLDPFTLRNLGISSDNPSIQSMLASLSIVMLWSLGLIVGGYKNWLSTSWLRAIVTVTAPYLLFLGIWSIFAFS